MHYMLCPRCKFRVALNKHMCSTCGYVVPPPSSVRAVSDELGPMPKAQKGGFWAKFFGLEPQVDEHTEPPHEEPALG